MPKVPATNLRLALFTDTMLPQLNGVTRTLDRLVNTIHDRGGEVRVFTTTDPVAADDPRVRRYSSIPFWAYPELRLAAPSRRKTIADLLDFKPTLIHAATPFGVGIAGRNAAFALNVPLVTSYHTSFSAYASFYKLGGLAQAGWNFLRWFHNSGVRTYVPTHAVRNELEGQGFSNVDIWGRGIDPARFAPRWRSAAMRERLGADNDTVVVAYVGRLALEKGVRSAAFAMRQVMERTNRRVVFALAGDGPYAKQCRTDAPPGTVFLGRTVGDELSEFYASADIFLFPSTTDTFGNVLLEAGASGLAIAAANAGATRELLGNYGASYFTGGDEADIARSVLTLVNDPEHRKLLAQMAQRAALPRSWDAVFDALIANYWNTVKNDCNPNGDKHV